MPDLYLAQAAELLLPLDAVVFDCRFALADPGEGRRLYAAGHVPGAHYLDLEQDLSGTPGEHGGRHPLPDPQGFAARLAAFGVDRHTPVIAYDDSRLGFAARLWWLMRSLGYRSPRLLDGGYRAFLDAGGEPETITPAPQPRAAPGLARFSGHLDVAQLGDAQARGAVLVDSREEARYAGLEEPIDPVAGHIPGALNRPWQGVTGEDGRVRDEQVLRAHWGDLLEAGELLVYCGSGVTACVNLFSLAMLGQENAQLYAGSWSDWCSYL